MNGIKSVLMAMKIINTCQEHDNTCSSCPFNINGCIVSDGNSIPQDWKIIEIIAKIKKGGNE